jgi:rod shape-determining protein MreD
MMPYERHEILLPVKPGFIALTLAGALVINVLPWSGVWLIVRPDLVALTLLYWCVHEPRRIGFTVAFTLGLMMDTADASLFGQHALSYSVLAYAGIVLHRRVQSFSGRNQMLHVIALLLANDVIVLFIRVLAGSGLPGYSYFTGSLIAGALWPLMCAVLRLPQVPKPDPTHV